MALSRKKNKESNKRLSLKLFRTMLLIRRFEERASQMYGIRKIGGFCHLYIGQEAVAAGSITSLDLTKDYVVSAYRDHGQALACGLSPDELMAELFGKKTGCSKGKGGSMHFFSAEKHMLGGNGIVGSQIPVATGVALKLKYKKEPGVVLCFFGDGAIHQGAFHESLNLAKIWDLPIVYICENNQYGMGTDFKRVSSVTELSITSSAYGIAGEQVDGMDVMKVYDAVSRKTATARNDHVPGFLEIKTYRYKGHSMSDPATYRTKEEVAAYKEQDPILLLKVQMIKNREITEEKYKKLDNEIKEICRNAVSFAEGSEEPLVESLYKDIIA
ncbi:MAG: pyruvate dehydrogenase (acetyl-transferring) E1 component subunit alpha [Chitinivibrionales bacterium]|nr:pyruvate dehydrogenase (acetyl-transferring) E1 component subunit alpha [Chitinivibrionales bacterium]